MEHLFLFIFIKTILLQTKFKILENHKKYNSCFYLLIIISSVLFSFQKIIFPLKLKVPDFKNESKITHKIEVNRIGSNLLKKYKRNNIYANNSYEVFLPNNGRLLLTPLTSGLSSALRIEKILQLNNINDFEEEKSKNKYLLKKIQTRKNNLHYATCLKLPQIKNSINKNLLVFFKLKPTKTFSCIFTLTNNKKNISRVNYLDENYFEFK